MMHMKTPLKTIAAFLGAVFSVQPALASGYHFGTQSVTAQSTANAAAAEAVDASTIFYNPAGLAKLENSEITAAANIVMPHIEYSGAEAAYRRTGTAVGGETSGTITKKATFAPHLYGAYKAGDVTVGLGVYVPFASATDYSGQSVLRHHLNRLGLTSIAVEPVVAYKFNDKHSVGAGLIAQHSSAELRKYADWDASGTVSALASRQASQAAGRPVNVDATGHADGHAEVKGKDWGFGYQFAWLWDINDRVRVGANYRSKVKHKLKGSADWYADGDYVKPVYAARIGVSVAAGGSGYVPHEKAEVEIVTPESLSLHGMYKATDRFNLFGDVTWTRHSRFNKADLVFGNTKNVVNGQSNRTTITPNWRNTYKIALGGSYQYSEPLQLRAGIAFDQSPVKSAEDRLNTMPDANRMWFSVGARYAYKKRHVFDTALSYVHIHSSRFNAPRAVGTDVDSKGASSAKFKASATILGLQYTYKFE